MTEVIETTTVKGLEEKEYLTWVDVDYSVAAIKDHVEGAEEYDTFFVDVEAGDYSEVWGMYNTVPYHGKTVYRIR